MSKMIKLKKLVIENQGYKRKIFLDTVYLNSNNIISISDYEKIQDFLLTEESNFAEQNFALIRISTGSSSEEIIACGSAEKIFSLYKEGTSTPGILHD